MNLNFTLVIELLSFAILVFILTKILYNPLLNFLEKRKSLIQGSIDEAKRLKEQTEKNLQEAQRILKESKNEALGIKERAHIETEELRINNIEQSKNETAQIMDEARQAIQKELDSARSKIKKEVGDISIQVAEKLLAREIKLSDHKRLVDEAIDELSDGSS